MEASHLIDWLCQPNEDHQRSFYNLTVPGGRESLYDVLRIDSSADDQKIKRAFRARAMEVHPDHGGTDAQMIEVQAAYEVLSDAVRRTDYDRQQRQSQSSRRTDPMNSMFDTAAEDGLDFSDVAEGWASAMADAFRAWNVGNEDAVTEDDIYDWLRGVRRRTGVPSCAATTTKGHPCLGHPYQGGSYCYQHTPAHLRAKANAKTKKSVIESYAPVAGARGLYLLADVLLMIGGLGLFCLGALKLVEWALSDLFGDVFDFSVGSLIFPLALFALGAALQPPARPRSTADCTQFPRLDGTFVWSHDLADTRLPLTAIRFDIGGIVHYGPVPRVPAGELRRFGLGRYRRMVGEFTVEDSSVARAHVATADSQLELAAAKLSPVTVNVWIGTSQEQLEYVGVFHLFSDDNAR